MTVENILKDLEKDSKHAYMLAGFTNIKYISNFMPTGFAFCIIKENPVIYVSKMDMELANLNSTIDVKEFESFSLMIDELKQEGIKNLAIEPSLEYNIFSKFSSDFNISPAAYIDKQRMIKNPEELKNIKKATEIAQKSFLQLDILNNRNTEREIAFDLVRLMIENGASGSSFDTIVTSGSNSSLPHALPQDKQLEKPILIDWGAKYNGYCSDNTRTMIYYEKQHEIFDIVKEAYDKSIKKIKPGIRCCDIDKAARDIIEEYGYGDNFIHSTGHSLGLDIHEIPGFSSRDETVIEEGMVITVEPGIYLEGEFGVRLEDTIAVSKKANIIGDLPLIID